MSLDNDSKKDIGVSMNNDDCMAGSRDVCHVRSACRGGVFDSGKYMPIQLSNEHFPYEQDGPFDVAAQKVPVFSLS